MPHARIEALLVALAISCASATPDPLRLELIAIKREALSAGYAGDGARLRDVASRARANPAPLAQYWAAYALWQRAINTANDTIDGNALRSDLEDALEALERADKTADTDVLMLLVHGWLITLDQENARQHVAELRTALAAAKRTAPSNQRVRWAEATNLLNTPPAYGGNPDEALRILAQITRDGRPGSLESPEPDWGLPEAYMSTAYAMTRLPDGELEQARTAAEKALVLQPEWRYVREVLLPQIRAKAPGRN